MPEIKVRKDGGWVAVVSSILFGESTGYTVDDTPQTVDYTEDGYIGNLISSAADGDANGIDFSYDGLDSQSVTTQMTTHSVANSSDFLDRNNPIFLAYDSNGNLQFDIFVYGGDWNIYYFDAPTGSTGYQDYRDYSVDMGADVRNDPEVGFEWDADNSKWAVFAGGNRYVTENGSPITDLRVCDVSASGYHNAEIQYELEEV